MNNQLRDIFFERSLRDIRKSYLSGFSNPTKNFKFSIVIFVLTGALCLYGLELGITSKELSKFNNSLVGFGVVLAGSGVGIIIAGFAIMAGSLDKNTFGALSKFPHEDTDVPMLNFIFSIFVYVLLIFLRLFTVCFCYLLVLNENSPAALALRNAQYIFVLELIATLVLVPVIGFTLLSIRSFVKNLHGSLLLLGHIRSQMQTHSGSE